MTKIAGSGSASGSISQRYGSADADPDPDPPHNVMDPQHCSQDPLAESEAADQMDRSEQHLCFRFRLDQKCHWLSCQGCVSFCVRIRTHLSTWIRIRTQNTDLGPDPVVKLPFGFEKIQWNHLFKNLYLSRYCGRKWEPVDQELTCFATGYCKKAMVIVPLLYLAPTPFFCQLIRYMGDQGVTKRCRLSSLTNMSSNAGGGCELRGLSQWVQLCSWSPNKL